VTAPHDHDHDPFPVAWDGDEGRSYDASAPVTVLVDGVRIGRGSRVVLRPSRRADILDLALTGRTAEVESVREDFEGNTHVAVVLDGDPGRDLGSGAQIGHRFFFAPDELAPVPPSPGAADGDGVSGNGNGGTGPGPRVLVAGIGNMFLADDGFGPEVAAVLRDRPLPPGTQAADFGIRGMDLAFRILEGWDAVVLVDAAPHGRPPGTLTVFEPDLDGGALGAAAPEAHAMDPVKVLALARHMAEDGAAPLPRVLVVGCEPERVPDPADPDVEVGLSDPVRAAVLPAADLVLSLLADLRAGTPAGPSGAGPQQPARTRPGARPHEKASPL
jgi:hydrogenase maturation protease